VRLLRKQPIWRQVVVVTCLLIVPYTISALWAANRTRVEREEEVQEQARSVAATAASYVNQYLAGLDALALALVRHPAVAALDRKKCDRLFAEILNHDALLSNVALVDPDGRMKGSGLPTTLETVAIPVIKQVITSGKPVVTELMTGPVSGKPAIMLAYPVRDDAGTLAGVLILGLNVIQFQTLFHAIPLPEGSVVTLTDAQSRVLARTLDAEKYIGRVVTPSSAAPRDVALTREMTGLDGVERFYGNAAVDRGPWLLSVGIPSQVALDRALPVWRRGIVITVSGLLSVLVLALLLSKLMARGVNRMRDAAQRIANGDLSPPERVPAANRELGALQDAFITMAANLREAHGALDHQVEQERKTREAMQLLQRQVVRQERLAAVGVLVSGVAHELNNPLQAILGTAELLERRPELTSDAVDEISFIKTQSGRAREIIRNLSRFSSQQSGPPSPVDLRDVIDEVVQLRRRNLDGASIVLDVQASSTQKVYANFTEVEQVALNFVLNAQQAIEAAGRPTGRISIRVFDTEQRVRVEVDDDGPGVSTKDEPKLFQPFFTTKPVGQGTGLGLSVSYGIIESYGGSIGYRGNPWGGATFFFELPAGDSSNPLPPESGTSTGTDDPPSLLHKSVPTGV
jgi:C4-dicarboxylate-specific signal transduction histidine kinase